MIVKMKFLSISGPRTDIDRVSASYLSKYEMQLENAITELKTTDNLMPFMDVNPYKEPLSKAEQYVSMLAQPKGEMDTSLTADEILSLIHISEPTRRTPISYAVFCLKKKKITFLLIL